MQSLNRRQFLQAAGVSAAVLQKAEISRART